MRSRRCSVVCTSRGGGDGFFDLMGLSDERIAGIIGAVVGPCLTCVISTSPMPDHERSGELYYPSPVVGFGVELRLIHHRARKEGSVHDRERVE